MSLFENWLAIELQEKSLKETLSDINAACGTKYKHNWPSVVRNRGGSLGSTSKRVRQYMMHRVLEREFPDWTDARIKELINKLT